MILSSLGTFVTLSNALPFGLNGNYYVGWGQKPNGRELTLGEKKRGREKEKEGMNEIESEEREKRETGRE
jgi:hypothetical protein